MPEQQGGLQVFHRSRYILWSRVRCCGFSLVSGEPGHSYGRSAWGSRSAWLPVWPDDLSYAEVDLTKLRGHRQITDAYLVALVRRHVRSQLATMDERLAEFAPDVTFVLPR